jgi:pimeloyl-ACP methyl ester carboxylesterase
MFSRLKIIACGCLLFLVSSASYLLSQTMPGLDQSYYPLPTMGGKQFWSDELFFHKWRIQRNVFTGHCRLLDGQDWQRATGTYDDCLKALEDIKRNENLPPMKGKAVIVLHGLFRSRNSMDSLCDYLAERGGYEVFNVSYPSTRADIGEHARSLAHIIDNLDGIEEVNFVAHSMGNVVIRYYLNDLRKQESEAAREPAASDTKGDKRPAFKSFVMLGPPNHEAQMAAAFGENILFKTVSGQPGQQLGAKWSELERNLAVPNFDFAIVAGGKINGKGYNPLLSGDNDGTISVESAKLMGARDFIVLPVLHTFIMNNEKVHEITLRFMQKGYFLSEAERHPLEE